MRLSIDSLTTRNLLIWVTEVDVDNMTKWAVHFQQILEEVHAPSEHTWIIPLGLHPCMATFGSYGFQ